LQSIAIQYTESALQTAKDINNQLLESHSWGSLGKLIPKKSEAYFKQALGSAQSIQAWDIAYQWQHQLGDLYRTHIPHFNLKYKLITVNENAKN
jgi:hypothetical protein